VALRSKVRTSRSGARRRNCDLVASAGLALAGFSNTLIAAITALTLANVGISSAKPPWSMPTLFLSGPTAAMHQISPALVLGNRHLTRFKRYCYEVVQDRSHSR
jgi:hypothetical protein